ncbi:Polyphosphate kinase 2 (EC 2.7.4.1) [uncultured Gammaproteobacteria bacterium]|jgi:polyphosphate kinase 2|nr:Polyphosphate kinase 2 (EC 2.7.4.1) [uncultured Gammaproteobacteria bacterium]CAC9638771.1 Polyphosphate kinase 2 (EC 2.7.4.1) [uncultured Gammaproteobacteria bacterium]CAC9640757.1 Polyphosphate kinase 2 (EC 2.7.4.1) [uncultured Gammaproteobacteria bacterium]CAC9644439.1 Polyphosphate kinase 2 (EC 2.7.4.1) [uncultured Gammaproteobacteria bacterium]CAC9987536.1 Polyphosphate kinase 2 (EC 2.7.4.1) [uncultured Gammaproteobacteria bacterium]
MLIKNDIISGYITHFFYRPMLSKKDFKLIHNREELKKNLSSKDISFESALKNYNYEKELVFLQIELNKLQSWIEQNNKRVIVVMEGRDAAGKGGSIRRFLEHMNPRSSRLVALNKPTDVEQNQWYLQRYIKQLANAGEFVIFDRSWYNRAVVEPVMGFCTKNQYKKHIRQVPEFEHMLYEDGVHVIKIWFSITKDEQLKRFESRMTDNLKKWKLSPVDIEGQKMWDIYTKYKEQMFNKTHTSFCPWTIIQTNDKKTARLESIRHVLSQFDYDDKIKTKRIATDPNIVIRYNRSILAD